MKVKQTLYCVVSLALASILLLLLAAFVHSQVAQAQSLPAVLSVTAAEAVEHPLKVFPNPPQAYEPTELRLNLFNSTGLAVTRYAQFYWSALGLGVERHPIGGRLLFDLPPNQEGAVSVMWVPPDIGPYGFYVEVFDLPGAPAPIAAFENSVLFLGHPDPATSVYTHTVPLVVHNPFTHPVSLVLSLTAPAGAAAWQGAVNPPRVPVFNPGQTIVASTLFTYTGPAVLPPGGLAGFRLAASADGQPMGAVEITFGPPVQLHARPDPPYAESEISVNPYPLHPGEPAEICAEVRNVTLQPRDALVFFRAAPFGIGPLFTPVAPPVFVAIPALGQRRPCVNWVPPSGGQFAFEVLVESPGLPLQVSSQRVIDAGEWLEPGTTATLHFPVRNPLNTPATISMTRRSFRLDWDIALDPETLPDMQAGETRPVTLTVSIPPGSPMPLDEALVADVEAWAGTELIGGFRKIYRPPVPLHGLGDPIYAESEISVRPYPPREREPTEICVELRNPTQATQVLTVEFRVANFGIGLPWHAIARPISHTLPAQSPATTCVTWVPPFGGRFGVEVALQAPGHDPITSQRVIDVGEILLPNQPTTFVFNVGNPYPFPITATLGAIRYLPQWEVAFAPPVVKLQIGEMKPVTMTVVPVQRPGDPEPKEGEPVVDVEAYWEGNGDHGLLGGFRKLFFPPLPIHQPADPPFAEREINVFPYPPRAGEPTRLAFEARNPTNVTQIITVTFEVGPLGIGLPFQAIASRTLSLPPQHTGLAEAWWVPPFEGEFCVRVRVEAPFFPEPFYSSRNIALVRLPPPYGTPEVFTFLVGDGGLQMRPLTVSLGLKEYLADWHVELGAKEVVFTASQTIATAVMTITPPASAANLPKDGGPIADVSGFVDGKLIGGLRKTWRPPVPLGHLGEATYAESEISIRPDPPVAGRPATFATEVRNNSDYSQTITIQFGWADFGFGIPFTNTNVVPTQTVVTLGPHLTTTVSAQWTPIHSGHFCVQIILSNPDTQEVLRSQRNVDAIEVLGTRCASFTKDFLLQNSTDQTVSVTIGSNAINLPLGWTYAATPTDVILAPFASITVTVVITPPCAAGLQELLPLDTSSASSPAKLQVEGYDQNGDLLGGIEMQLIGPKLIYLPVVRR